MHIHVCIYSTVLFFSHNTQLIFANEFCSVIRFVLPRYTSVSHVALHPLTSSEYTSPLCGPSAPAPFNTMMILHISYGFLSRLALLPSLTSKFPRVPLPTHHHLPSCLKSYGALCSILSFVFNSLFFSTNINVKEIFCIHVLCLFV